MPEVSEEQSENIVSTEKPEEIENGFIVYHYVRFFDGAVELTGLADSVLPEEDIVFPKLPVRKFHRGSGGALRRMGPEQNTIPEIGLRLTNDRGKEPVFYAVYERQAVRSHLRMPELSLKLRRWRKAPVISCLNCRRKSDTAVRMGRGSGCGVGGIHIWKKLSDY